MTLASKNKAASCRDTSWESGLRHTGTVFVNMQKVFFYSFSLAFTQKQHVRSP